MHMSAYIVTESRVLDNETFSTWKSHQEHEVKHRMSKQKFTKNLSDKILFEY